MNTARVIAWSFAGAATLGVLVLLASWYLEERRVCEPLGRRMTDQEICEAYRSTKEASVRSYPKALLSSEFSSLDVQLKSCKVRPWHSLFGRGRYLLEYAFVKVEHHLNVYLPMVVDECGTVVASFNPNRPD